MTASEEIQETRPASIVSIKTPMGCPNKIHQSTYQRIKVKTDQTQCLALGCGWLAIARKHAEQLMQRLGRIRALVFRCFERVVGDIQPSPGALTTRGCELALRFLRCGSLLPPFQKHTDAPSAAAGRDESGQGIDIADQVPNPFIHRSLGREICVLRIGQRQIVQDFSLAGPKDRGDSDAGHRGSGHDRDSEECAENWNGARIASGFISAIDSAQAEKRCERRSPNRQDFVFRCRSPGFL